MVEPIYKDGGIVQIVEFHSLYPERMTPKIAKNLAFFEREDILRMLSNLSAKLANKPFFNPKWKGDQNDIDLLRFCFGVNNIPRAYDAIARYKKLITKYNNSINYVATTESAVLYLLRELFSCRSHEKEHDQRKQEKEIFDSILTANQLSQPSIKNNPFEEKKNPDLYYSSLVLAQYGVSDTLYPDYNRVLVAQTILCVEFFEWAQNNDQVKPLLGKFCEIYGLSDKWWLYPKSHWGVWAVSNNNVGIVDFRIVKFPEDNIAHHVMDLSSINKECKIPKKENRDYKEFRANPLIKLSDDEYYLFNITLFLEHMYNSLYFIFNTIASTYFDFKGQRFNQLYTTEFSEKHLLDRPLKEIFDGSWDISYMEEECIKRDKSKDASQCGAPDYYARKGKIVVLVENKDIHVKDTIRELSDIKGKVDLMYESFVTSPEGKRKAIRQLLRNVARIRSGEFQKRWDPDCPSDAIVYPLIVVGDYKLPHSGVKNLLVYWQSLQPENDKLTRPVVLTDVSTILLYKEPFKKNGIFNYFEDYYKKSDIDPFLKSSNFVDLFNGLAPFPVYMQSIEKAYMIDYMKRWEGYIKKE